VAEPNPDTRPETPLVTDLAVSLRTRWLARFATSFVVVGLVLAWQGFHAVQADATGWRGFVELFGAAASFAMGVLGVRERHKRNIASETENPER
jgi:hypothetical protein